MANQSYSLCSQWVLSLPLPCFLLRVLYLVARFFEIISSRFIQEGFTYRAAALTFTTLLSIVPLVTVILSGLSLFPVFQKLGVRLESLVYQTLVPESGDVVKTYIQSFVEQAGKLPISGFLVLVVSALLLVVTIEHALNHVWKVKRRRRLVSAFALYWTVLTVGPLLIALSVVVSSYLFSLPFIKGTVYWLGLHHILLVVLPFFLGFLGFFLLYMLVPNCKVRFFHAVLGAATGAILFELAKTGFRYYVQHYATFSVLYGALATIPIFLIWLYLCWVIILMGGLVAHSLSVLDQA